MPEWWNGRHSGLLRGICFSAGVQKNPPTSDGRTGSTPVSGTRIFEVLFNARSALNLLRSRIELWNLACDKPDESLAKVVESMNAVQARSKLELSVWV